MKNLLTALFDYRVKRFTLVSACLVFAIDMIIHQFGNEFLNLHKYHVLFQYLVLLSLMCAVGSKDKIDDELSKEVRYGIFKTTFSVVIALFGILAVILSSSSITSLNTLTIMYCLEGIMVVHLILYYFGIRYHPQWLLKEETAPKEFNMLMVGFVIVFFFLILLVIYLGFQDNKLV